MFNMNKYYIYRHWVSIVCTSWWSFGSRDAAEKPPWMDSRRLQQGVRTMDTIFAFKWELL